MILQVYSELTEGSRDQVTYSLAGLPDDVKAVFPELEEYCCGKNKAWSPSSTLLRLDIGANAPLGRFEAELIAESGGVQHSAPFVMEVRPFTAPSQPVAAVVPAVRRERSRSLRRDTDGRKPTGQSLRSELKLRQWEQSMRNLGKSFCNKEDIVAKGSWEGNIWYYDGIRAFYQVADYLNDPSWNACAEYVKGVYQEYVIKEGGRVQGWRPFPHGLYMSYVRTGDPESKRALLLLAQHSAFAANGGSVTPEYSRETAYMLSTYRLAEAVGEPRHRRIDRTLAFALGHISQWFPSEEAVNMAGTRGPIPVFIQPFMVGLTMEALIQYYEQTADPRVPEAVKTALDGLWNCCWVEKDESFVYSTAQEEKTGAPDLNLLIAPAFAWMYHLTGDETYRFRGDKVFDGGVAHAYLGTGKHFSQNYRWSFDYIRWRLSQDD